MKILMTGSTGFIGKNLIEALKDKHELHCVSRNSPFPYSCNLSNSELVKNLLYNIQPKVIIHLAGNPLPKLDENSPTSIIDDNIKTTLNLLHYAPSRCKFIFASSIVIYGSTTYRCGEKASFHPTNIYGVTKIASECLTQVYQDNLDCITNLRLCATIGPNMNHGLCFDLLKKINNESPYLELLGDKPGSSKPYIHIKDVIQAIELAIDKDIHGPYNVVPDDELTVEEVANLFLEYFKSKKEIKWLGREANWKGDNSVLKSSNIKLKWRGWKPQYATSREAILGLLNEITKPN